MKNTLLDDLGTLAVVRAYWSLAKEQTTLQCGKNIRRLTLTSYNIYRPLFKLVLSDKVGVNSEQGKLCIKTRTKEEYLKGVYILIWPEVVTALRGKIYKLQPKYTWSKACGILWFILTQQRVGARA